MKQEWTMIAKGVEAHTMRCYVCNYLPLLFITYKINRLLLLLSLFQTPIKVHPPPIFHISIKVHAPIIFQTSIKVHPPTIYHTSIKVHAPIIFHTSIKVHAPFIFHTLITFHTTLHYIKQSPYTNRSSFTHHTPPTTPHVTLAVCRLRKTRLIARYLNIQLWP